MTSEMRDPAYLGVSSAAEGETLATGFVLIPRDRAAQKNVRALDLIADRHGAFHPGREADLCAQPVAQSPSYPRVHTKTSERPLF